MDVQPTSADWDAPTAPAGGAAAGDWGAQPAVAGGDWSAMPAAGMATGEWGAAETTTSWQ